MLTKPAERAHALLGVFTTTIKGAGAHVSTGRCRCGWTTESTYQREVREAYRAHKATTKENHHAEK